MKKVLSILLAMLMIGSVATISTMAVDDGGSISAVYNSSLSASRFNDFSSITPTYQAAVSYMADNGILSGYADNTFNPKGVLTRGAASKIISNLILGPSIAEKLAVNSAPFKDVPIDNVFAGYIAYCSVNGICNGYSDGSFRAFSPLTTGPFAKMLLNFVEYSGDSTRYVGNNWANNVRQDAIAAGIIDSDADLSTPVTREYAAYMSYNAIRYAEAADGENEKESQENSTEKTGVNSSDWVIDININNDENDLYTDLESVRIGSFIYFHALILDGPSDKINLKYKIEFSTGKSMTGSWNGEAGVNSFATCSCRYTDSIHTEVNGVFKLYNATTGKLLAEKSFIATSPNNTERVYYRNGLLSYQSYVGVECKGTFSESGVYTPGYTSGASIYVYDFTTTDDFNSYLKYLTTTGWSFVKSQSDDTYFCYYKSGILVSVWYVEGPTGHEAELAEVWVTISK